MKAFGTTLLALSSAAFGAEWNYDDPNNDWTNADNYCGTMAETEMQSPIDINSAAFSEDFPVVEVIGGMWPSPIAGWEWENNGHTLVLSGPAGQMGGMKINNESYDLIQLHFHWHSEYYLKGQHYPLEAHLVHAHESYNHSLGDALGQDDGVAVLGIFFEATDSDNSFYHFGDISYQVREVMRKGQSTRIDPRGFYLGWMIPENVTSQLYNFAGSLTTPPCTEKVRWFVYNDPIPIHTDEINTLRFVSKDTMGAEHLDKNYRPLQPDNGRPISCNFEGCDFSQASVFQYPSVSSSPSPSEHHDHGCSDNGSAKLFILWQVCTVFLVYFM
jgi:carbonic anhydrase